MRFCIPLVVSLGVFTPLIFPLVLVALALELVPILGVAAFPMAESEKPYFTIGSFIFSALWGLKAGSLCLAPPAAA